MHRHERLWVEYFYPETFDVFRNQGTLRNNFGERDPQVLQHLEYRVIARRQLQLTVHPDSVERTYDAAHLRAIHRHLFQDVYSWAGEYRHVDILKGSPGEEPHMFAEPESTFGYDIADHMEVVEALATSDQWEDLDEHDAFAWEMSCVFAHLNQAHPFREGNGRTSKIFLEHLAERSPYELRFDNVTQQQWIEASKASAPVNETFSPNPDALMDVFERISVSPEAPREVDGRGDPIPLASASADPPLDPLSAEQHAALQQHRKRLHESGPETV